MAFQIDGTLHKIFNTEQKSEKFRARDFVIEVTDGKFPQMIKFQLTQDKCEAIDEHREGDQITVHFDLRGREWNEKYFTNLNAWRIESAAGDNQSAAPPQSDADYPTMNAKTEEFSDDIPF
ncbi:hypothetical protein AB833_26530 [Chromatiales bacterium (ex Bugula neritina AB1)]|nr:hypothetical protein AB833_26530 [Chromatiales bacterium (ex Bugula neritina AB1)]